ncbi:MAG: hypothetical protein E7614_07455 [Ruminococcaceae bacterium]|nr:hypothetical protein [Oscillospiraceae bacterium]
MNFTCTGIGGRGDGWLWKIDNGTRCLDVNNGSMVNGKAVDFYTPGNAAGQRWFIIYSMNGYGGYYLLSPTQNAGETSNICFLTYTSTENGGNDFQLNNFSLGSTAQTFMFKSGNVSTTIVNRVYGTTTSIPGNSSETTTVPFNTAAPKIDIAGYTYVKSEGNSGNGGLTIYRYYTAHTYNYVYYENRGATPTPTTAKGTYPSYSIANQDTKKWTVTLSDNGVDSYPTATWTFTGWNTKADGSGTPYAAGAKPTSTDGTTFTLYAQWDLVDADITIPTENATVTLNPNNDTNATEHDSIFTGWYKNDDTLYTSEAKKVSDAYIAGVDALTAKWDFEIPEGLLNPTRDGFTFYGWSDEEAPTSVPDALTSLSGITENKTLNAYWLRAWSNLEQNAKPDGETFTADVGFYGENKINLTDVTPTLKWIKIGSDGETVFENQDSYTVTDDDKGHAIKCVTEITVNGKTAKSESISALYVGDTLVDATPTDTMGNEDDFEDFEATDSDKVGNVYTITYEAQLPVSQMNLDITGTYNYSLYGIWNGNKVLIIEGTEADPKALLKPRTGVSMEGEVFDSYELVIEADGDIQINDASIRYLPRVYALDVKNPINETKYEYLIGDNNGESVYTQGSRTEDNGISYFYGSDIIKIYLPIASGEKIDAGSYILIGGVKVHPTASITSNDFITFEYTNGLDIILKGEDINNISFDFEDLKIDYSNIKTIPDLDITTLNFGPLGAKIKLPSELDIKPDDNITLDPTLTYIRFGTVWYFDDLATGNSWSRKDAMGTFFVRLKMIIKVTEGNDFYNYLSVEDSEFLSTMMTYRDTKGNLTAAFFNTEDYEAKLISYLNDFLEGWEDKGKDTNNDDYARKPSFGEYANSKGEMISVIGDCPAEHYYYDINENDEYVMEYSAVLEIPENMHDEKLIYFPYVSYVKGTDHWVPREEDEIKVYLLGEVQKVYTVNGINDTAK